MIYKITLFDANGPAFASGYSCPVEIYAAETTIDMAEIAFKKESDDVGQKFLVTKYSMSGV